MCNVFYGSGIYSQASTEKLISLFQEKNFKCVDLEHNIWVVKKNEIQKKDNLIATEAYLQDVEKLLNLNADPNASFTDKNGIKIPFISFAAKTANPKLTKLLLTFGANPNTLDNNGKSCLGLALCSQAVSFVTDDHINQGFGEYLLNSIKQNLFKREETVSIFLESGAKTKIFNRTKENPIHNLIIGDVKGVIIKDKYLKETKRFDGNPKSVVPQPGMEEGAIRVFDKKEILLPDNEEKHRIIKKLVENGINLNLREKNGYTPLHLAVMKQYLNLVRTFIEHGGDVNAKSNKGITPLHLAAFKCNRELVDLLLAQGAKIAIKDNLGRTPSDFAIMKNNLDLAKYIKDKKIEEKEKMASNQLLSAIPVLLRKGGLQRRKAVSFSRE
jgi:ankyrin repeat protein